MTDHTANDAGASAPDWPLRPWLLAGLLGLAGLVIQLVTGGNDQVPWQMAASAFLFFGAMAAAFTLERDSWKEPAIFAVAAGLVMAGLAWRAVRYGENLPDEQYGFAAGVVATALALPLFQAGFLRKRLATPYSELHYHVWTDAISAAGALAFTGLSWLALVLMSELFHLLKIDFLRDLMEHGEFGWTFSGLAFGAALGTLRNQLKVLGTMQSVVLLVLSLLAVPLAFGLTVFLLATAVYGPQTLWDATRSATPVLLACAAGAWVLASAIVRYEDEAMSRSRIMRVAALVLAAVILPLAVFAAVSMGLRLGQYGLAPERLWGLVAIVVACVYGLGFWLALIRGRKSGWAAKMRQTNFHLGLFVCGFALLLALPILDFGAISARNQVARLESGRVTPERFDFTALRWDFGKAGRRALERLSGSGNAKVAELAQAALAQRERVYATLDETNKARADFNLRVQPDNAEVRERVLDYLITNPYRCADRCVALDLGEASTGGRRVAIVQSGGYELMLLNPGHALVPAAADQTYPTLGPDSEVEVSEALVIRIDGKVVGPPID